MPEKMPLHIATWVRPLADYLDGLGVDPKPVLRSAGISLGQIKSDEDRLPFDRIACFFELAAQATGDDSLGFHFGQTLLAKDAGMIGYVGLSAPSLYDALLNLDRYRRVYSDAVVIDTSALDETGELFWDYRVPVHVIRRQFHEFSVAKQIHSYREATGTNFRVLHVAFPHHRKSDLSDYRRYFGGTIEFGADRGLIRFSTHDLHLRVRTADSRLHGLLQVHCRAVIEERGSEEQSLVQKVERLIVDRLTSDRARLDIVAVELGMSSRTLTRRLRDEGTTFNGILESVRQGLARSYLKDSALNLSEIAYLLGYSEVSAFNHAFKRWTGSTPSQLRAEG